MKTILKKAGKIIPWIAGVIVIIAVLFLIYINLPVKTPDKKAELGITYSARYAESIGLDNRKAFTDILDGLQVKNVRLPVYWDLIEPEIGKYDFSEIDWQLGELESHHAKAILVVGQKVPRWPECFIPEWAKNDDGVRKQELLNFINVVVNRYKGNNTVYYWQVENEPFLSFGVCPAADPNLLDLEIATVRSIDANRKIIITDSGELSLWREAAKRADIFGTTMYRSVVSGKLGGISWNYPIGPNFFKFKYWLIKKIVKQENIMVVELQGEPWLNGWTTDHSLDEQFKSMNAEKLRDNIDFARKTGFSPIYLWGAEWWYWLKDSKDHPEVWEEAKNLFKPEN
jgi:hypothetical protein